MGCSAGMMRLVDVLDDPREEIRNELLLLLLKITDSNAEIQNSVAFQDGFERLVRIIDSEGVDEGGIIIKDCLQIVFNLVGNNKVAQKLFLQVRSPSPALARALGAHAQARTCAHPPRPCASGREEVAPCLAPGFGRHGVA